MFTKDYYIYIMSNENGNVMYIGVTNDLIRRVYEHKGHFLKGFTDKYNVEKLIYYEQYNDVNIALDREKQLKHWNRKKKEVLVDSFNKERRDLYLDISG